MDRDAVIAERAASNAAELVTYGRPMLTVTKETWIVARADGRVMKGGLGAVGTGRMWVQETDEARADVTYADAPFDPEQRDDFGCTGNAMG